MKRKTKKDIKSIIHTMKEAHERSEVLLCNRRLEEASEILAQCQECAIQIGETIEKSEGMNTRAVIELEKYCESLYELSKIYEKKHIKIVISRLNRSLHFVLCEIDKIPSDKIKVVFMPYKVSMWDCMESVWEAAVSDEECEVYVVPIPYYDRNDQGNLEKECYEGDLFPDYVPVSYYKEFSLELERPDIIYIHNPYDAANYVTSVHPDYYSFKLRGYTDTLVYIPYFLSGEGDMPETHRNLPAYQYVDKIIVQDESKAESLEDFVQKEKILVVGSPKVDRILKLASIQQKNKNQIIPMEWKEKVKDKKVILFNVSITGVLQNSKYVVDKIKYVISIFELREDVVLLWRPHPLLETTLKSMRPELYKEYVGIKNNFIKRGIGIFDETGDAVVAAVVADAYLGENTSSLINYFGVLNKPVLYINWKIIKENLRTRNRLTFYSFYREKDSIIFSPINKGLAYDLYSLDLENGVISEKIKLPGLSDEIDTSYVKIVKTQNQIILVPYNAADIYIYDTCKKQSVKIVLPNIENDKMLFDAAVEYEHRLFLLPQCYHAIVSIDLQNFSVYEYEECVKGFRDKNRDKPLFRWAYCRKDQYLYLASCNESKVIKLNMEDESFEIKNIGDYEYGYFHMLYDGKYFWLAAYENNYIVRWDEVTGDTLAYSFPVEGEQPMEQAFLIDKKEDIIVCCGCSVDIMFINKNTGKCSRHKKIRKLLNGLKRDSKGERNGFAFVEHIDADTVVIYNWGNSSINLWNINTDEWKSFPCRLSRKVMLDTERRNIEKNLICKSTPYNLTEEFISISQYLDYVTLGEVSGFKHAYQCYKRGSEKDIIGYEVHEEIKKEIKN